MNNIVNNISKEDFCKADDLLREKDHAIRIALSAENAYYHGVQESYPYISFSNPEILWQLFDALSQHFGGKEKVRFIDVGCGTGRIVKLARIYGLGKVHGLEFHKPYVDKGIKEFGLSLEDFTVGDAFDTTPEFLDRFNCIYTYMPIHDRKKMGFLALHLASNSVWNTVHVEMLPDYFPVCNFDYTAAGRILGEDLGVVSYRSAHY